MDEPSCMCKKVGVKEKKKKDKKRKEKKETEKKKKERTVCFPVETFCSEFWKFQAEIPLDIASIILSTLDFLCCAKSCGEGYKFFLRMAAAIVTDYIQFGILLSEIDPTERPNFTSLAFWFGVCFVIFVICCFLACVRCCFCDCFHCCKCCEKTKCCRWCSKLRNARWRCGLFMTYKLINLINGIIFVALPLTKGISDGPNLADGLSWLDAVIIAGILDIGLDPIEIVATLPVLIYIERLENAQSPESGQDSRSRQGGEETTCCRNRVVPDDESDPEESSRQDWEKNDNIDPGSVTKQADIIRYEKEDVYEDQEEEEEEEEEERDRKRRKNDATKQRKSERSSQDNKNGMTEEEVNQTVMKRENQQWTWADRKNRKRNDEQPFTTGRQKSGCSDGKKRKRRASIGGYEQFESGILPLVPHDINIFEDLPNPKTSSEWIPRRASF